MKCTSTSRPPAGAQFVAAAAATATAAAACADLKPLAGIAPLVALLAHGTADVQEGAAYVLGTAAANNEKFQGNLFAEHPGVVKQLLEVGQRGGDKGGGGGRGVIRAKG